MKSLFALTALLACSGCASVINDTTHPVKVETKTQNGELVAGATCKLSNDYGVFTVKSGDTTQVRRSGKDLEIVCTDGTKPEAKATAISRASGAMWGNVLLGGGVGAIIDHNKGTAYTYPKWMQLVFGKTLVFDRRVETEGQPTVGFESLAAASAPTAAASAPAGTPAVAADAPAAAASATATSPTSPASAAK